jgi:hypothetical protein
MMVAKMQYFVIISHDSSSLYFNGVFSSAPSIFNSFDLPNYPTAV